MFPSETRQHTFHGFLDHRIFIFQEGEQGINGLFCAQPGQRLGRIAPDEPVLVPERFNQGSMPRASPIFPNASAACRRTIQLLPNKPSIKASTALASPIFLSTRATSSRTVPSVNASTNPGTARDITDTLEGPDGGRANGAILVLQCLH